jgi:hypothetical protein
MKYTPSTFCAILIRIHSIKKSLAIRQASIITSIYTNAVDSTKERASKRIDNNRKPIQDNHCKKSN